MELITNDPDLKERIAKIISERTDGMYSVTKTGNENTIIEYMEMLIDYCYYAGYVNGALDQRSKAL